MTAAFVLAGVAWVATIFASYALGRASMHGRRVSVAKIEVESDDPDRFVQALVKRFDRSGE